MAFVSALLEIHRLASHKSTVRRNRQPAMNRLRLGEKHEEMLGGEMLIRNIYP